MKKQKAEGRKQKLASPIEAVIRARSISALCLLLSAFLLVSPLHAELTTAQKQTFLGKLVVAAKERTRHNVRYDGAYVRIPYPNGDVPASTGVCTDEVIRSYRKLGIDLQKEVHEDMRANFSRYPKAWGLTRPDTNIDHRRVPNLMTFFSRKGEKLPVSRDAADYRPGDLVTWDLGGGIPHIGIVVDVRSSDRQRHQVVHNVGAGPKMEDVLFTWKVTGHYRYYGN